MKIRILLLALAALGVSAFAQNVSLTIGSGSGSAGSTVQLPITITSTGGAAPTGVNWTFAFSPSNAVTGFSITPGASAAGNSITCAQDTRICVVFSFPPAVMPNGNLGTANIQLSGSATGTVSVSLTATTASDTNSIPSNGGSGTITVTSAAVPTLSSITCTPGTLGSSQSSTCTASLSQAAVGATVVSLSDSSAQLTTPASVTIPNGATSNTFTVTSGTVSTSETATVTGTLNSISRSAAINLTALSATLNSLSCTPTSFTTAGSSTCTVSLTGNAAANTLVTLSDNSPYANVPASVTVLSGQSSAQFSVSVTAIPANDFPVITATLNGVSRSAGLTLTAPVLSGISCVAGSLNSNQNTNCTATLNAAAVGSMLVTLSDNSSQLTTPPNVTIPNGQTTGLFSVSTGTITTSETVTVTGSLNGLTQSTQISLVSPTGLSGLSGLSCAPNTFSAPGNSTCTVSLASAASSDTVVSLSANSANVTTPPNVTVANGQSSAQFTANVTGVAGDETVTLTASLNGGIKSANLTLGNSPLLTGLSCGGAPLSGNQTLTCTATINKASAGGTVVSLSDNSAQLTTPANVTIANGQTTGQFTVSTATVSASETVTITGTLNGVTQTTSVSLVSTGGLSGLTCSPNTFSAPGSATCTVTLGSAASSNTTIQLADNSGNVSTPATATVTTGRANAQFAVIVAAVPGDETVTITASLNGGSATTNLTLTTLPLLSSLSCSGGSLTSNQSATCTAVLNKAATAATVVTLSHNSAQLTTPASVTIANGQTSAQFTVTAGAISTTETEVVSGTLNAQVQSARINLVASASGLSGFGCSPSSFSDAGDATCTVSLASAASSNTVVSLSENSANVTIPASVTIQSGQSSTQFTVNVIGVPGDETVTITAGLNGGSLTTDLTLSGTPLLSGITCVASSLGSEQSTVCAAALTRAAVGATTVILSDSSNQLATPLSVTIDAGQITGQFSVFTGTATTNEVATITGTWNGVNRSTQISLLGAVGSDSALKLICSPKTLNAGQSVLCDITLNSPAPEGALVGISSTNPAVALPSAILVPVGQTSAQFRINAPDSLADGTMDVTAALGGSSSAFTIILKGADTPDLLSLSCTPATLAAGESTLCTVSLTKSAIAPTTVSLIGVDAVVTLPAQLTIQSGSATGTFAAKVGNITSAQITTLYANYAGKQVPAVLNLTGPAVQPSLESLNCAPSTVPSGTSSFCTVTFTGRVVFPATLGITPASNLLKAPAQLSPSVGVTSISFAIQAGTTDTDQTVVLGLTWSGSAPQSQTIRVTPQAAVAVDAPTAVFTRAGQPVSFDVKLVRSSSFGAQVIAPGLPDGATFQNMHFAWTPGTDKVGEQLVEIRAIDNSGTSVSSIVRVVVRPAEAAVDAMVNPAGFTLSGVCTPNSIMTLLGHGFSVRDPDHATAAPLPTTLGGVRVRINSAYTPLLHVQDDLIHFQCPQLPAATDLQIVLEYEATPPPPGGSAQSSSTQSVTPVIAKMSTASPGIYIVGGTQGAVIENASGLIAAPPNSDYPTRAAAPGDYLVIYGNGMGIGTTSVTPGNVAPLNPLVYSTATVSVDFGDGIKVPAAFAGLAPGYVGLFQVNVQVPAGTKLGPAVPITIEMRWPDQTVRSNSVTVAIQPR